jgi:hypothetical protein
MEINGINMEDIYKIENTYDNLKVLDICKYLLGVVVNDIQYMNDASDLNNDNIQHLDLGNNTKIRKDYYESLYSVIDTINFIEWENKPEILFNNAMNSDNLDYIREKLEEIYRIRKEEIIGD